MHGPVGSVVEEMPAPVHVWLLKKGDRGVQAIRTWKKRLFVQRGVHEVAYWTAPDEREPQGAIDLRHVSELVLAWEAQPEPELRVVTSTGRIYVLRLPPGGTDEGLAQLHAHWAAWVSFVRRTPLVATPPRPAGAGAAPSLPQPVAASVAAAPVPAASEGTPVPSPLPVPPRPKVPSLAGNMPTDRPASHESPPRAPARESPREAPQSASPPPMARRETSPRKLPNILDAAARALGKSLQMPLGGGSAAGRGDGAGQGPEPGFLKFSLLPSLQPHLPLYFVLSGTHLTGYADETRAEVVELLELKLTSGVERTGDRNFRMLFKGEPMYFGCADEAECCAWVAALREINEFVEAPELGSYELHLDVAEEVDIAPSPSAKRPPQAVTSPPLPPRPKGMRALPTVPQPAAAAPTPSLPPPVPAPRAAPPPPVSVSVIVCPVCSSVNDANVDRCVECGSSDGFRPVAVAMSGLGSPMPVRRQDP